MALSQVAVQNALDRAQRIRAQLAAFKARNDKEVGRVVQAAEVAGTACVLGLAAGRYGKDGRMELAGVPLDLVVGLCSLAAGVYCSQDNEDDYAQHFHAIGSGALALYLGRYGTEAGMQMRARADNKSNPPAAPRPAVAGWDPPYFGAYGPPQALPASSPLTPRNSNTRPQISRSWFGATKLFSAMIRFSCPEYLPKKYPLE